ncbi:MAG: FG-GAP-like repeat-containing protein [Chitinophagales bacterium]
MKSIFLKIYFIFNFVGVEYSIYAQNTYQNIPGDISGYTIGDFNVTDGGSAVYNIPIQVSPGTAGMDPKLSLTYNSQSGNGLLGQGWSLQGLGVISASSPTLAQDGFVSHSTSNLRYSLEGERLVLVNAGELNGGSGVEYRTEQNAFLKITSVGSLGFPSNNIPQYFEVKSNSGITSEYGNTSDSKMGVKGSNMPNFWLLNKAYDTKGNYMTITYQNSFPYTGEYYPLRIDYTGNSGAGLAPYASVVFYYESRPDTIYKSYQGSFFKTTKRLKSIKCYYQATLVREYNITYDISSTLSKISQIQECGLNGNCFAPTIFNWNNNNSLSFTKYNNNTNIAINDEVQSMDINADGAIDIIKYKKVNGTPLKFYINRKNGNFLFDTVNTSIPILFEGEITFGDFNGDGKTDIVTYSGSGNKIYLNNSSAQFGNINFTLLNNYISLSGVQDYTPLICTDFNGDGRSDLLFYDPIDGSNRWFFVDSSTSNFILFKKFGSNSYTTNLLPSSALKGSNVPYINDFDGDGLSDILIMDRTNGSNTLYKNTGPGTVGFSSTLSVPNLGFVNTGYTLSFTDVNGDGFQDLFFYNKSTGDNRWVLNYGNFTFSDVIQNPNGISSNITGGTNLSPIDFNNDGYADLFWYDEVTGNNKWIINASNTGGIKFGSVLSNAITPLDAAGYFIAGSGNFSIQTNFDFLMVKKNISSNVIFLKSNLLYNNTLSKVTQGNNSSIQIQYSTIADDNVYTKYNDASYPLMDYQGAMPVVKRVLSDDGVGNFRGKSYRFAGAKFSLDGRGFRGFAEVHVTDELTGIVQSRFYDRSKEGWKYISSPLVKSETRLGNGIVISSTSIKNGLKVFYNDKCHYSYVEKNISKNYEINGLLIDSTVNTQQYDDYGNVLESVNNYSDGYRDSLVNTYDHDDYVNWILGRLTKSTLYRFAPGQPAVVRSAAFEYDPTTGLLLKEITEPDLSDNDKIVKQYLYDAFGNIKQSSTTAWNGTALETRTVITTYDPTGRFTLTAKNPLGHTSIKTYDPALGFELTEKDPNGLTKKMEYDAFGRVTKEISPDGNWQTMDYRKCGNGINCPPNAVHLIYTQSSVSGPTIQYYDILNREIQTNQTSFDGKWIIQQNTFDNRGYLITKSLPYHQDSIPVFIQKQYDLLGRETQIIQPGNRIDSIVYQGRTTITINAKGQKKTALKDAKENVIRITDELGNQVNYQYDVFGKPVKTIDPNGNTITIKYDVHGNKTEMNDPDMGLYKYTYNSFGELISQVDPKQQTTTLEYDLLGRMKKRTDPDGVSTFTYDNKPYGIGSLGSISSYNGFAYDVSYDTLSRKISEKETIDTALYNLSYLYDYASRVAQITYPSGYKVNQVYNNNSYLTEIRQVTGNKLLWKANKYNAFNQLESQQYGNNVTTISHFDPLTRYLVNIYTTKPGKTLQNLDYSYDALGNLTQRKNEITQHQEDFTYDKLNRLIKSQTLGGNSVDVTYDPLGNITYKSDVGYYTYGSVNNGPHRLKSINQTTNQCIASLLVNTSYNAFNKVKEISKDSTKVDVYYDASQQRVLQKMYNGDTLVRTKVYVGKLYEKEIKRNGTKETNYIFGPEGVVATYEVYSNGTKNLNYWHKDHLGSIVMTTNDSAQVTYEANFDAWGKRLSASYGAIADSFVLAFERGFTGHEHYDMFDLIDMNGRIYDPILGRFLSPDPYIQDFSNLQSFNRYSYVLNNPLSYTDPTGYFLDFITKPFKSIFNSVTHFFGNVISGISDAVANGIKEAAGWVKENWKTLAVVAVAIVVGILTCGVGAGVVGALGSAMLSGAAVGFSTAMTASLLNGGSLSQSLWAGLKGAAIGAACAGVSYGIGQAASGMGYNPAAGQYNLGGYGFKVLSHGVVQGGVNVLNGGKFEHGFYAGAFSAGANPAIEQFDDKIVRISSSAAVGGTASVLGGGKFANGAVSGAFVQMFNGEGQRTKNEEFYKAKAQMAIDGRNYGAMIGGVLGLEGGVLGVAAGAAAGGFIGERVVPVIFEKWYDIKMDLHEMNNNFQQQFNTNPDPTPIILH